MNKEIPLYFDATVESCPCSEQENEIIPGIRRAKVRVFSKYGNRNGSYITDQVAEMLITSAIGHPVVGWYDPETESWGGHVGNNLVNGYGYVESFIGWEPFLDTDGITRDYAVFSVVLFCDYFDAANKIVGSNQSMELNPNTIDGDWVDIEGTEYFVFSKAQIYCFCVIGTKEPCFSVSAFFTKNASLYEQFQSCINEMRSKVEDANHTLRGGKSFMENQVETLEAPIVEEPVKETSFENTEETLTPAAEDFTVENTENTEEVPAAESVEEPAAEVEEPAEEPAPDYEALYTNLKASYEELQANYEGAVSSRDEQIAALNEQITGFNSQIETLSNSVTTLTESLNAFKEQAAQIEMEKKKNLCHSYDEDLSEEEIAEFASHINEFSYDELEAKLAIAFSHKTHSKTATEVKIPHVDNEPKSAFASLMEKYKK